MGEALIDFVHQYPALWDEQDAMYKAVTIKKLDGRKAKKFYTSTRKM